MKTTSLFRTICAPCWANISESANEAWVLLAPYGKWPNAQGLQTFEQKDAENMVNEFNSLLSTPQRMIGLPWYVGHPDHPAFKDRYTDTAAKGRIKKLEARADGLWANVKWNDDGKKLIEGAAFHGHSVNWRMKNEKGAWRPFSLKSVGFTNEPNIPVPPILAANEAKEGQEEDVVMMANAGTSEGNKKGWQTRRGEAPTDASHSQITGRLSKAMSEVHRIQAAHAEGAMHDAAFDAGEWSGPAHFDAEKKEVGEAVMRHGFTPKEYNDEITKRGAGRFAHFHNLYAHDDGSAEANHASAVAHRMSAIADKSNKPEDHAKAVRYHKKAAELHDKASQINSDGADRHGTKHHKELADTHRSWVYIHSPTEGVTNEEAFANAGDSEGAKKGWEHRRFGTGGERGESINHDTGHTFHWMKSHGTGEQGEVSGFLTNKRGKAIPESHGWYRTHDPEKAAMIAHDTWAQGKTPAESNASQARLAAARQARKKS